jgi:hypothetical protein
MSHEQSSLFQRLNAPFPYHEYKYDQFGNRCYVSGQTISERLNEVLGVGYWKYQGLANTEKVIQEPNGKGMRIKIYVEFSFYNSELKEWITLIDVGSEQIKLGMNEGDATKSAITDGMKKCASRIGVASDLYKGLITWSSQQQMVIVPAYYKEYYEKMNINTNMMNTEKNNSKVLLSTPKRGRPKKQLTEMLKASNTGINEQIQLIWLELAGNLDGYKEWYSKKQQEQVSDQQILHLLQTRLHQKKEMESA